MKVSVKVNGGKLIHPGVLLDSGACVAVCGCARPGGERKTTKVSNGYADVTCKSGQLDKKVWIQSQRGI